VALLARSGPAIFPLLRRPSSCLFSSISRAFSEEGLSRLIAIWFLCFVPFDGGFRES
jgi:hypothetical protein